MVKVETTWHNVDNPVNNKVSNQLKRTEKKLEGLRIRIKDKSDRATTDQVLDPRTIRILSKIVNQGHLADIHGCVSTGKEANVYHATTPDGTDRVIKIYKTSILVFKDRDKYVNGEFRFRRGYCKSNPRKMVQTWAEKEMRNLHRLHSAEILCPKPYLLKSHILVMDMIGEDGLPAPLLKNANIKDSATYCALYLKLVVIMRKMFHECKLVHADLSEFNTLYLNGEIYIIDVSQSVEHDHVMALEFLRKDCFNVNDFFRKKQVATLTTRELFDFITDISITKNNIDEYLNRLNDIASSRTIEALTEQEKIDDEVFKSAYIPQRLDDVIDFEKDVRFAKSGNDSEILYRTLTGMKSDLTGARLKPQLLEHGPDGTDSDSSKDSQDSGDSEDSDNTEDDDTDESSESGDGSQHDDDERKKFVSSARPRNEDAESKKSRKKEVKQAQRLKRETNKIPKHVKKRRERQARLKKN